MTQDLPHHPHLTVRNLGLPVHPFDDLNGRRRVARKRRGGQPLVPFGPMLPVPLDPDREVGLGGHVVRLGVVARVVGQEKL